MYVNIFIYYSPFLRMVFRFLSDSLVVYTFTINHDSALKHNLERPIEVVFTIWGTHSERTEKSLPLPSMLPYQMLLLFYFFILIIKKSTFLDLQSVIVR